MSVDITDVSGNSLHLTNTNDVLYDTEGITPFYRFDGTNWLEYSDATAVEFNILGSESYVDDQGLTLMCWARHTDGTLALTNTLMGKFGTSPNLRQYALVILATGAPFAAISSDGLTNTAEATAPILTASELADWQHYCMRWRDNDTVDLFINGERTIGTSQAPPLAITSAKFMVGARQVAGTGGVFWDGDITMVGVYAAGLNGDQISTIYEMTAPLFKSSI